MTDGICPFATQIHGVQTFAPGSVDRVGFCDHTAGGYYSTLTSAAFWNSVGVSTHFAISQKGEIAQMVNIFDTAWAQGLIHEPVTWAPYDTMGRTNPNSYLISTEHEDKQVTNYLWSAEMYDADLKVKRWCVEEVKRVQNKNLMRFGIDSLAGHFMFDPVNRKYCPGDGWPREQLWKELTMPDAPSMDAQIRALVALAHFIRNGWQLGDLSPEDRAAIKYAAGQVPE